MAADLSAREVDCQLVQVVVLQWGLAEVCPLAQAEVCPWVQVADCLSALGEDYRLDQEVAYLSVPVVDYQWVREEVCP